VVILQGLARLSNCVVSGCASNGIELNDQRVMQSTKKCVRYVQSKPTLNGQVVVDQGVDLKNPARRVVLLASGETISLKAACVVPLSSSRHAAWPTRHEIECVHKALNRQPAKIDSLPCDAVHSGTTRSAAVPLATSFFFGARVER
jgi:hypothetical protein